MYSILYTQKYLFRVLQWSKVYKIILLSCCVYSEEKQCPLLPASLTLSCQIETLFQVLLLFTVWRHSVSMAYQPLVQVSHWAVEWQDLWNNSDRFDPHFQHNGLSVS